MLRSSRSPKAKTGPQRSQEGFALLSVLWLLLLATVLVASIALWTTKGAQTRSLLSQDLRAQTITDAAFETVVFDLITKGRESPWAAQDGPVTASVYIDGNTVMATVSADAGKVDLNAAPDDLILRVFELAGLTSTQAQQSLFALRDAQKARVDLPKIATLTEARTRINAAPETFACLEPLITVHTNARRPNLAAAPGRLKQGLAEGAIGRSVMSITPQQLTAQVFRVQLSYEQRNWASRVLLTGDPEEPYWLYDWLDNEKECA